jgi:DNA-binding protein HU-beta
MRGAWLRSSSESGLHVCLPCGTHTERIDTLMPTADSPSSKIVGKEELAHLIAAKAHVALKEADAMLDALTDTVREEVAKGHQVRLIGFGSWKLTSVSARTIKSIRGGAPTHLPAHKRVSFSTGSLLAEAAKAPTPAKKTPASKKGAR